MLSKKINNKKCAPVLLFFNKKIIEEDSDDFDIENWLWKSNFGTFWQLTINPKLKIQSFPLGKYVVGKNFLILYPPFENSTTRIAIALNAKCPPTLAILNGVHWEWLRREGEKTWKHFSNCKGLPISDFPSAV